MNTDLEFQEWGRSRTVTLTEREARVLGRHTYAIRSDDRGDGRFKIGPVGGFVGSIRLSPTKTITIKPRLPLNSFASLLALAYDEQVIPVRTDRAATAIGNLTAWCVAQTVAEAQKLLTRGIRRDYIAVEERRLAPRGRLIFSGASPRYDGALSCITDDFLLDTSINRYVKAALTHLWNLEIARPWRIALRSLIGELSQISNAPWHERDSEFVARPIYRDYRTLISLLRLISTSRGSDFSEGALDVSAFFFRLHELFEKAIYRALRRAARSISVIYQPTLRNAATFVSGSPNLGITFKPDMALMPPTAALQSTSREWRLVIDAKYRNPIQYARFGKAFRQENIYQILAYCRAFGCPGLLVYPRVDQDVDISYRVGEASIRILTVDLMAPDLNAEMDALAEIALKEITTK